MKVVIYTAIYGDYDDLKPHSPQLVDQTISAEFVLFNEMSSELPKEYENESPRVKARYFKLNPHKISSLKNFDIAIWVDGSALIKSPLFVSSMIEYLGDSPIMCFKHPEARYCIYEEAVYAQPMPKYRNHDLLAQTDSYAKEDYPIRNGLFACGMMVYNLQSDNMKQLCDAWWAECLRWPGLDQLSLPYCSWKLGIPVKPLLLNQYGNDFIEFRMSEHKSLL